jgi:hypothetical protein
LMCIYVCALLAAAAAAALIKFGVAAARGY